MNILKIRSIIFWGVQGIKKLLVIWLWDYFMKEPAHVTLTIFLASGGAMLGVFTGAINGATSETGILNGAKIGVISGASAFIQLYECIMLDAPFYKKVEMIMYILDGLIFMNMALPPALVPDEWQSITFDGLFLEHVDEFHGTKTKGLIMEDIKKLPGFTYNSSNLLISHRDRSCSICIENIEEGELLIKLPQCGHCFHSKCISAWLACNGSCPTCRTSCLAP